MGGSALTGAAPDMGGALSRPDDRWVDRRLTAIWLLLFFNVLPWMGIPVVVPIPQRFAQLLTMGALAVALFLALSVNPRLLIRPSLVLGLFSVLAVLSLMTGVRGTAGVGAVLRSFRFMAFISVLWLLTPWWGRRDLLLARCHLRALLAVCATVLAGLLIAPSIALGGVQGRLSGVLWPIWPTAVAHFAAVAAGICIVLWLAGSMRASRALLLGAGGTGIVVLTHTRVALVALVTGLITAGLSLFLARRRVRRATTVALLVAPLAAVTLAPAVLTWFMRGQTPEQIHALTGRRHVWEMLLAAPRPEFNRWFGLGLSDKGFAGRPIDNSWLAIFQDQGLIGVFVVAAILLFLLVALGFRPPGPARALAVYLVVFVAVESVTQVGLGDASPYLLDLVVAASLIAPRPEESGEGAVP